MEWKTTWTDPLTSYAAFDGLIGIREHASLSGKMPGQTAPHLVYFSYVL